jgi:hypothetical protein
MSEPLTLDPSQLPDISNLVLEDDTPLDSFINEKQQRLLTTVLYSGGEYRYYRSLHCGCKCRFVQQRASTWNRPGCVS